MKRNFWSIVACIGLIALVLVIFRYSSQLLEDAEKEHSMDKVCKHFISSITNTSDLHAQQTCLIIYSLQYNFYPSPIQGLFSYQTWNGFDGFWQNGVVLESLANWIHYANNTQYKSVLLSSIRTTDELLQAYYPQPSFDDMAWYGLSYVRIHEVLGADGFIAEAGNIFDWVWDNGWDHSGACGGGVWFDQTHGSKQTIENVQMLQLAAKLYRISKDEKRKKDLLHKIQLIWKFIENTKIINATSHWVADGVSNDNCLSNGNYGPTYNMGVAMGGLIETGPILGKTEEFDNLAYQIANATIANSTSKEGILVEWCEPECNDDAKIFKAIFLRNLRYLVDHARRSGAGRRGDEIAHYRRFIELNSDAVWRGDRCEGERCRVEYRDGGSLRGATLGSVFGQDFRGPYNFSAPMQQTSALDLFIAGLDPGVRCVDGPMCAYDPVQPGPHQLTCRDDPCPSGQDCCAFDSSYYTCCMTTQRCVDGECV